MEKVRDKPTEERGNTAEPWRARLVNILLLVGAASIAAAAFLVSPALGFFVFGAEDIIFAFLIHASGGDGTC